MPIYDFKCAEHGMFHELVPLDRAGEAFPCPKCHTLCTPVILVAPHVIAMSPSAYEAAEKNEQAQHQPLISTEDSRAEAQEKQEFLLQKKAHKSHSCDCSEHRSEQSALKKQVVLLPDGSKVFPSQRPWMISH